MKSEISNEFKEKLFLKLTEGKSSALLKDSLNDISEDVIQICKILDGEELSLTDLSEGPATVCSLSCAIEKVAYELQNDRNYYAGFREVIARNIYRKFIGLTIESVDVESLSKSSAESFLNELISATLTNKKNNESV